VLEREQEQAVGTALAKLPDAERQIIEARFGTGGRPELSIREAARALGVTQNAARELEARALARLATDGSLTGWRAAA
jgi:RNA polymerase sigma factor (sigma-70 family)